MNSISLTFIFVSSLLAIAWVSSRLVPLLAWIARYFKLSEYTIAFIMMAAATSIPELFVGVNSALGGIPELSFGNILGANLLNVTLVLGLVALIRAIVLNHERIAHEAGVIFALTILPAVLWLDGTLSRIDGVVLVFIFFGYILRLLERSPHPIPLLNAVRVTPANFSAFLKKFFLFLGGILTLLLASQILVFAASTLAENFGMSPFLIGLFILSFGTTLPELTFGLYTVWRGHGGMGLGNAIGSVVFNLLFILGTVSIIQPINVAANDAASFVNLFAVAFVVLLLNFLLRITGRVTRTSGVLLILFYIAVATLTFTLSSS